MAEKGQWIEARVPSGRGYECTKCGLIVGGDPVTQEPARCPVCVARAGKAVAIVAGDDARRLSMLVLDRRLLELVDKYRKAKREHERDVVASALINQLGNYEIDDIGPSADIEASASREQRAALALADATAGTRMSRPSIH